MGKKSSIWGFVSAFREHWFAAMSGGFSVPFAFAAALADNKYIQIILLALAFSGAWFAAYQIWKAEHEKVLALEEKVRPKLKVSYDKSDLSCDGEVEFNDGTKSRCVRLKVENIGTSHLEACQGWMTIKELPGVSPVRLIWTGPPEKGATLVTPPEVVDLHNLIPQYVQIFRIQQTNRVIPGTQMDAWPINAMNKFVPGQEYEFKVGVTARNQAGTVLCILKLNWTGDWQTATVTDVTQQSN